MFGDSCRFCPFTETFASVGRTNALRKMEHRQWSICTLNTSGYSIGSKLADETHQLFQLISFEEWVQEALVLSPAAVRSFRIQFETLSKLIFDYLQSHTDQHAKYLQVIGVRSLLSHIEILNAGPQRHYSRQILLPMLPLETPVTV